MTAKESKQAPLEALRAKLSDETSLATLYDETRARFIQEAMVGYRLDEIGEKSKNFIRMAVADLVSNVPFSGNADKVAELVYDYYPYFHLGEIKYCFNHGIMGLYGDIYGTVNTHTIMNWMERYRDDSEEVRYWK